VALRLVQQIGDADSGVADLDALPGRVDLFVERLQCRFTLRLVLEDARADAEAAGEADDVGTEVGVVEVAVEVGEVVLRVGDGQGGLDLPLGAVPDLADVVEALEALRDVLAGGGDEVAMQDPVLVAPGGGAATQQGFQFVFADGFGHSARSELVDLIAGAEVRPGVPVPADAMQRPDDLIAAELDGGVAGAKIIGERCVLGVDVVLAAAELAVRPAVGPGLGARELRAG
jgi:hypothetical protein